MAKGSDNNYPSVLFAEQGSNPSSPAASHWRLYFKSDGLYAIDDAGSVVGPFGTGSGGYTEGARVYNNANETISHGSGTALTFNSERYDTDGIHSTSSNTSRLTCQTAGKYHIFANVRFASNSTGYRDVYFQVTSGANTYYIAGQAVPAVNGAYTDICLSTVWDLAANDYVEVYVVQSSGGNLDVVGGTDGFSPEFGMQRIG